MDYEFSNGEKYLEELRMMLENISQVENKITTWHGHHEYKRIVDSLKSLIALNEKYEKKYWISN